MPDGTVVDAGQDGTFHAPPVTVKLTFFTAGKGGTATVNGVLLPGSSPVPPNSSTPSSGSQTLSSVEKSGVVTFPSVKYSRAGKLTGTLTLAGRTLGHINNTVAKGKATSLKVTLTHSGVAALRKAAKGKTLTLALRLRFKSKGHGNITTTTKHVTLS